MTDVGFVDRFAAAQSTQGPAVFGLDPSAGVLRDWQLDDDADGLEHFVDLVTEAAVGSIALAKPQSAFYERHGWRGIRALTRLVADLRDSGVLVILDAKRGDVGSTNEAYAQAYLGDGAALAADALTITPYLGLGAMGSFFDAAVAGGAALFVVTRSSNDEGRAVQAAIGSDGRSVEQQILDELAGENERVAPGALGPFGAVFAPTHETPTDIDLRGVQGLFLAPGVGAQGATLDDVARCFAACPDRVLPSASRSLLSAGPEVSRLRDEVASFADGARTLLAR